MKASLSSAKSVMNELNQKKTTDHTKATDSKTVSTASESESRPPQKRNLETMLLNRMRQVKKKSWNEVPTNTVVDLAYDTVPEHTLSQEN